ncbi:N-glycosylase/DNA lyase [Streptobacillus felis]|uniref:8-oxoguanine DNA glycosylase/AP lyase n=1 Tax=Streptobacillus felis TaxID=1384509 RepID=A0A7Z0PF10_9FUSO|nr:N-glycosylase/DNA lyase [Streptobacillus felis]NYV27332.1 N-glycosylase/DNA lyase [Streptobacillus felis]
MNINLEKQKEIDTIYKNIKKDIDSAIKAYANTINYSEEDYFAEIAFCILTPQSKAKNAWSAIEKLKTNRLLYNGSAEEIVDYLNVVRFKNNKSKYLILLRELMTRNGKLDSKNILAEIKGVKEKRDWILENIKGMGLKEAAHVLRNLGYGRYLAILDRHVLKNLKELGVIEEIPSSLTKKKYFEIEDKMEKYSEEVNIPMDALDLVFWYQQAGEVFK